LLVEGRRKNPPLPPPRGEIQEEGRSHPPLPPPRGEIRKKEEPPLRGEIQEEGRRNSAYTVSFLAIDILILVKWTYLSSPVK